MSYKSSTGAIRWSESTGNVSPSSGGEMGIAACGGRQLNWTEGSCTGWWGIADPSGFGTAHQVLEECSDLAGEDSQV